MGIKRLFLEVIYDKAGCSLNGDLDCSLASEETLIDDKVLEKFEYLNLLLLSF